MAPKVYILDNYYLAISALITIGYQLFFFAIAFTLKFDKLTDFAGGTNFLVLAIITHSFANSHYARQLLSSIAMMLWGLRLSAFLLFRILKTGKDDRFDDKRDKFFPFLGFWVFQMVWVWTVSLPVTFISCPAVTQYEQPPYGYASDIVGLIMWAVGMILESWSDIQKFRFRSNPANQGATCDKGVFSWSRHPNYFAEILLQFGIFTMTIAPSAYGWIPMGSGAYAAQYAAIVGPFFLTLLLLFVSGLTLQERPGAKKKYESDGPDGPKWSRHKRWLERTSILIPLPPQLWAPLPTFLKRTVLFEWPMYVFDPAKHADQKKVDDRRAEEGGRGESGSERQDSQGTAVDESRRDQQNGSGSGSKGAVHSK